MTEEQQQLEALLKEDWYELSAKGFELYGFTTVDAISQGKRRWVEGFRAITRGPSGQHYAWVYDSGLTENQDSECWDTSTTLVYPREEVVSIIHWEAKP